MCSVLLVGCATKPKYDVSKILESQNVEEIEKFITEHPEDANVAFLKEKVITIKGKTDPNIIKKEVEKVKVKTLSEREQEEFEKVMKEDRDNHQGKALSTINQLFENDPMNKNAILMVENGSSCNIIIKIQGAKFYNLGVPANGKNSIVLPKGDYTFSSFVCGVNYYSKKSIKKNMLVNIGLNRK